MGLIVDAHIGYFCLLVAFLIAISKLSSKAKFYMKSYFFYLAVGLISLMVLFLSLLTPRNVDNIRYYHIPLRILSWILGLRFEVRGIHNIPKDKPCIIVVNHQTVLEPLGPTVMRDVWNVTALSRKENLTTYGPFGWATWLCGFLFIDRYNHKSAMDTMEKCAKTILTKQVKVGIFPEGTMATKTDSFLPFKKGAFNLAVKAQVPIVPIVFSTFNHVFSEEQAKFGTGKVIITCLPPVSTDGLTLDDVNDLTEDIRRDMLDVFKRTNDEVLSE